MTVNHANEINNMFIYNNKISYSRFLFLILFVFFALLPRLSQASFDPYVWPEDTWIHPSYGLYWLKMVDGQAVFCPANPLPDQSIPKACEISPYHKTSPTVMVIHGWEPGEISSRQRPDFLTPAYLGTQYDTAKAWLDKGWNVGIFYWDQFSDEFYPTDAEEKIWTAQGSKKMRWLHFANNQAKETVYSDFCKAGEACPNVGILLFQAFREAMKDYEGDTVRIAGHSLGSQLAVNLAYRIGEGVKNGDLSPRLLPHQVILLDPFYVWSYSKLNEQANALVVDHGVIISAYLSSGLTMQDWYAGPVANYATISTYSSSFCPYDMTLGQTCAHSGAWWMYFLSYKDKPPVGYVKVGSEYRPFGIAPSASLTDEDLSQLVNSFYWEHSIGIKTLDTVDDQFKQQFYTFASSSSVQPQVKKTESLAPLQALTITYPEQSSAIIALTKKNEMAVSMARLPENHTMQLRIQRTPEKVSNPLVLWHSSDKTIAEVFPGGFVLFKKPGRVEITATAPNTDQSISAAYILNVVA